MNEVDWEHVVEEIEDVGWSQFNAVYSYLRLMLVYLLKVHCWPESSSAGHSMRQRIDLERLYRVAREQVSASTYDGREPLPSPDACPFNLDQLLTDHREELEAVLAGASGR